MKFGLIGGRLTHSYSGEIHAKIGDYPYELRELTPAALGAFLTAREFAAVNVTIPYKQSVIPYLAGISPEAARIGAVNTVVNRGGALYGYNTDFIGMCALAAHAGVKMNGKKVLILGTGGTSLTAQAVAKSLGAAQVIRVSRTAREGAVSYEEAAAQHTDAQVLINTTPVGMYPDVDGVPIGLSAFPGLCGVLDAVYHPLRTGLILNAQARGIPAEGGLLMLVRQAVAAAELFFDGKIPAFREKSPHTCGEIPALGEESPCACGEIPASGEESPHTCKENPLFDQKSAGMCGEAPDTDENTADCGNPFLSGGAAELTLRITRQMLAEKRNLVLIGMPGAGKTTVGRRIAALLGKPFFDTDEEVTRKIGMPIAAFFAAHGEAAFREAESDVIRVLSRESGAVIATGGGAILREENVQRLKTNGLSVFLDRNPAEIVPTADRPLSAGREALERLYRERYPRYLSAADLRVEVIGDAGAVADAVMRAAGLC